MPFHSTRVTARLRTNEYIFVYSLHSGNMLYKEGNIHIFAFFIPRGLRFRTSEIYICFYLFLLGNTL